jgi:transcriptional regulator with XRE-family HTH domain
MGLKNYRRIIFVPLQSHHTRKREVMFVKGIREARVERNLSQVEVAERIGVSRVTISRWERGETEPKKTLFQSLCDALGNDEKELALPNPTRPRRRRTPGSPKKTP